MPCAPNIASNLQVLRGSSLGPPGRTRARGFLEASADLTYIPAAFDGRCDGAAEKGLSNDAASELYDAHASPIERLLMGSMTAWGSQEAKRALERTRACAQ